MQLFNYYVGTITTEAILQYPVYTAFAVSWLEIAEMAERDGSELMVVKIPKDVQPLEGYGGIPEGLQLVDADLLRELYNEQ